MHEVGHTLGLRHNFRASRIYTDAQLVRPGVHARERHHRLGDGVRADQPARARASARPAAVPDHARPLRLLGDRVRLQAARMPADEERRAASASPRAAPSRSSPTAPTRTTSSASIPRRCSSTSATTSLGFAKKRIAIARDLLQAPGDARAPARPGLHRAAPLGDLRAARRRPRGRRAGAPDRRRAHAARLPRQRPRPAAAGAGGRSSARRSTSSPAACSRPTACVSRRRCSAASAPDFRSAATRCSQRRRARSQTDYSLSRAGARPAARAARPADERHRRRAPPRQRATKAPTGAGRVPALSELYGRLTQASLERARRPAATSRRCAASCSASTSTARRRCCCARARASRADARSLVRAAGARRCSSASAAPAAARRPERRGARPPADSADTLEQALSARLQRAGA